MSVTDTVCLSGSCTGSLQPQRQLFSEEYTKTEAVPCLQLPLRNHGTGTGLASCAALVELAQKCHPGGLVIQTANPSQWQGHALRCAPSHSGTELHYKVAGAKLLKHSDTILSTEGHVNCQRSMLRQNASRFHDIHVRYVVHSPHWVLWLFLGEISIYCINILWNLLYQ